MSTCRYVFYAFMALVLVACVVLLYKINSSQSIECVRQMQLNDQMYIDTGVQNYALHTDKLLKQAGWSSVSINNGEVMLRSNNCKTIKKKFDQLSVDEQELISIAQEQFNSYANTKRPIFDGILATYYVAASFQNGQDTIVSLKTGQNVEKSTIDGASVVQYDRENFTVEKGNFPLAISRVFVTNQYITYVYLNKYVEMKPIECLGSAYERDLNKQVHDLVSRLAMTTTRR